MSSKKSYMNKNNLLAEGFFDKLFKKLRIRDKDDQNKIKSDRKLNKAVINLNKANKDVEEWFKKNGVDLELHNYSASDFLK